MEKIDTGRTYIVGNNNASEEEKKHYGTKLNNDNRSTSYIILGANFYKEIKVFFANQNFNDVILRKETFMKYTKLKQISFFALKPLSVVHPSPISQPYIYIYIDKNTVKRLF